MPAADIEYEPLPIHTSMFLVHKAPTARAASGGTWVEDPGYDEHGRRPEDPETSTTAEDPEAVELRRLRHSLKPLNGETAFIDTAAAFAELSAAEQAELEQLQVWRENHGSSPTRWLHPLVRTNPRSGVKSLHSPNSFRAAFPIEVDGMSAEDSKRLLDRLEMHILQPQFRCAQSCNLANTPRPLLCKKVADPLFVFCRQQTTTRTRLAT